jgi:hypothetical protein
MVRQLRPFYRRAIEQRKKKKLGEGEMRDAARTRALWQKDGGERAGDHRTKALGKEE